MEKLVRAGQTSEALNLAEGCWEQHPSPAVEKVWVAVRAAQAAAIRREWTKAVAWADRGQGLKAGDPLAEAWLKLYGGSALAHVDPLRAERELRQFLKAARGIPRLRAVLGDACYNLGYVYRALAEATRETDSFTEAARHFRAVGREDQAWICTYEIAWGHLLHQASELAGPYLRSVADWLGEHADPELVVDVRIAEALYHRQTGDLYQSDLICRDLREGHDLLPRQVGDLAWIMGCNALDQGAVAEAARLGSEAYDAAFRIWWPPQLKRIADLNLAVAKRERVGR